MTEAVQEKCQLLRLMEQAAGCALPAGAQLQQAVSLRKIQKGQQVFSAGEWQPYVYVVSKGIFKLTYLSENGQEWIKSFIGEAGFFACPNVLISGLKTDFFVTAIEDSQIEQVDYALLKSLAETYPEWQKAIRGLLESHIVRKEQRERELLTMTPDARYLSFLQHYPEVAARIQLRDLAHYLGVTPEALSRIRKRLHG